MNARLLSPLLATIAVAATAPAARAGESAPEPITAGEISALPGKGALPRREGLLTLTVGGELLVSEPTQGGQGVISARFAEAFGLGAGITTTADGVSGFARLDAFGLAINHWTFLAYGDYVFDDSWRVGGAMVVPLRRNSYLRLSATSDLDEVTLLGVGVEHDVW